MAIIQISKIQQRSGDLVDLPQLDEAEFGFASDAKRLYIGKENPNENIEVLTSYSEISFSQIEGSIGNLNISNVTVADGQVLAYDGNNWVNRGGNAGGLLTLGDVSNVKIDGGAIGYILETDGTGNLSWTPKSTIIAFIENITIGDGTPGNLTVITTTQDNFFTQGAEITITSTPGIAGSVGEFLNGNAYYADILTSNTFALYTGVPPTGPLDTSSYTVFPFTSVTDTTAGLNEITVGDSSAFDNDFPVKFLGNVDGTGLNNSTTYYVFDIPSATTIKVSTSNDGNSSNVVDLISVSGLTANVYATGGRIISVAGGGGSGSGAGGTTNSVQYNLSGVLAGDSFLTYNPSSKLFTVTGGNINTGNVNTTGKVVASTLESNVVTGTAPLVVTSTTPVANLGVATAATVRSNAQPNITSVGTLVSLDVTGNVSAPNVNATLITGTLTTSAQPNIGSMGNGVRVTVAGNLNPSANITYNLGNTTNRWNDLYLAGSTIFLGAQTISANATHVSISGILSANVSGSSNTAQTVTNNAQPNITSVGTLTSLTVTGNINAGNVNGGNLVSANFLSGTLTTAAQPNITSLGTLTGLDVVGTLTASNIIVNPGTFQGSGNGLFFLNASNLSLGTVPAARLSGTYTINISGNATNADLLDNYDSSIPAVANTVVIRDANATIAANTVASNSVFTGNVTTTNLTTTNLSVTGSTSFSNANISGTANITTLLTRVITTGANTTTGNITGNWSLTAGSRLTATYADLAEYYAADKAYTPGTVLEFGGEKEVTAAGPESNKIAGVVSTEPAYVMNGDIQTEFPVMIALIGRVPVKVKGTVSKGDMLVSDGRGYARASILAPKIGTVIGKAVENKFTDEEGIVEVLVGRL